MLTHSTLGDLDVKYSYLTPKVPINLKRNIQRRKVSSAIHNDDKCPICLDNQIPSCITLFPCGHKFHGNCLIDWMRSQNRTQFTCSLCRQHIQYFVNNSVLCNQQQINQQLNEIWQHQYEYKASDQDTNKKKLNANAKIFKPQKQSYTLSPIKENMSFKNCFPNNVICKNKLYINLTNDNKYCYDPKPSQRAKGNVQICRQLTTSIIPKLIRQNIPNLYGYMDKIIATQNFCIYDNELCIIDYGFREKETNQILYCVANRQDANLKKNKNYAWAMGNNLWKQKQIERIFGIASNKLPALPTLNAHLDKHIDSEEIEDIISDTKWHKIAIFNKLNVNTIRMTLSLTNEEFRRQFRQCRNTQFQSIQNRNNLVPILMFAIDSDGYRIEYVQIISLCHNNISSNVGISYKYIDDDIFVIVGIHLAKNRLIEAHELASGHHICRCLNAFESFIDVLQIGNPDTILNKLKDSNQRKEILKNENRGLKAEISELQKRLKLQSTESL